MKHYILTRFNVGLYSSNDYGIQKPNDWMNSRLGLFHATANSIKAQTCQNFEWLIEVDPNTPKIYLDMIAKDSGATILFEKSPEWIRKQPISADWLITSRIDNDDIYQPDFVKEIQNAFKAVSEVIDVRGVKLDLSTNKVHQYPNRAFPNSPFISLVEPFNKDLQTVLYRGGHAKLYRQYNHRFIEKELFKQVIHSNNLINTI
jgi:hypothetical protein